MADVSNALLYEVLKSIQGRLDRVDLTMGEMKNELQAIRTHMTGLSQDIGNIYQTIGRHDDRLARIEKRLGLLDPAH